MSVHALDALIERVANIYHTLPLGKTTIQLAAERGNFVALKKLMHENDYGEIWMVKSPNGGVEDLEFTPQQKMNAAL